MSQPSSFEELNNSKIVKFYLRKKTRRKSQSFKNIKKRYKPSINEFLNLQKINRQKEAKERC